jgi:hypothetical protein
VELALAHDTTNQLIAAGAALGGVLIGGLISLVISWRQTSHATAEREAGAAAARRARLAEILGRARMFLTAADPARVGINVNPETTPGELEALGGRLDTLREELSIFSAGADDDQLMARTAELEVALFNTLHWDRWHARDLLGRGGGLDSYSKANWEHRKAMALVQIVRDLDRGRDVAELEAELRRLDEGKPGAE